MYIIYSVQNINYNTFHILPWKISTTSINHNPNNRNKMNMERPKLRMGVKEMDRN